MDDLSGPQTQKIPSFQVLFQVLSPKETEWRCCDHRYVALSLLKQFGS